MIHEIGSISSSHGKRLRAEIQFPVALQRFPRARLVGDTMRQAFRTGDLSTLRDILSTSPAFVNYRRRIGDSTTALMAAAFHGDMDAVRYFLSLGAKASLVDTCGKTAALLAGMRGHRDCFAELQRVADEESAQGKGPRGVHDFVYDLYYFSPAESRATPLGRRSGSGDTARVEKAGDEVHLLAVCRFSHRLNKNRFLVDVSVSLTFSVLVANTKKLLHMATSLYHLSIFLRTGHGNLAQIGKHSGFRTFMLLEYIHNILSTAL